jgi:hypothetical protein
MIASALVFVDRIFLPLKKDLRTGVAKINMILKKSERQALLCR